MFNWNVLWSEDYNSTSTAQKMNFSIQDFFSKCGQIRRKLRFLSHLLKKSLMENFISVEEDFPSQFNFVASKTAPSFSQRGPIWKTVLEEIFQLFSGEEHFVIITFATSLCSTYSRYSQYFARNSLKKYVGHNNWKKP